MKRLVVGLAACLLSSCVVLRQEGNAVTPQRPSLSSDTSTTFHGSFELEGGAHLAEGGGFDLPFVLKYGLDERTEVFGGWSYLDPEGSGEGSGDVVLGARRRVIDARDGGAALALLAQGKLPLADEGEGLGSGEPDGAFAGIATQTCGDWGLTGFAQLDLLGDPDGGANVGQSLAFAAGRALPFDLSLFGEVAAVLVPELDQEQVFTTVGLTHATARSLVVDLGVIVGLSDDAEDFGVVLGFTRNLGDFRLPRAPSLPRRSR